jgi:ketosteroid isomerase-like protein
MNRQPAVKLLCLTLVCYMAAASAATEPKNSKTPPPADAKQQVLDLGKEWVAAEIKHDAPTLRRILDDKFVASFDAKKPYDKEAFIKANIAGDVDPTESQTLTDETVVIDGDTAIVVGTDTLHGTNKGTAYTLVARYTVTYIRRHGHWLALAEHLVEVPQAK